MAVTKEVYALTVGFTPSNVLDTLEQAFIDAGLMTGWHDRFSPDGSNQMAVLECVYDNTKQFGTTYYVFWSTPSQVGFFIGTNGWDTATHTFTGTQFLDYAFQPATATSFGLTYNGGATTITAPMSFNNGSTLDIFRYTSAVDTKQSWFLFRFGLAVSYPFAVHRSDTSLYPWLDLDKGMVPGFYTAATATSNAVGLTAFYLQENIRRAYPYGQAQAGATTAGFFSPNGWHALNCGMYSYAGTGKVSANPGANNSWGANGKIILPVGSPEVNPAYLTQYSPICSELPWTSFSSTTLATDLGVYMHYENNTLNFEDRFVVDPGVEEWEILSCSNNPTVTTGASPTFLARVV
jgi:hypothetical protein